MIITCFGPFGCQAGFDREEWKKQYGKSCGVLGLVFPFLGSGFLGECSGNEHIICRDMDR